MLRNTETATWDGEMLSAQELVEGGKAIVWNHETAEQVGSAAHFDGAVAQMNNLAE